MRKTSALGGLSALAALAALLLGLAACGGGGSSTQATGAGGTPLAATGASGSETAGPRHASAASGHPAPETATPPQASEASGSQGGAESSEGAAPAQTSAAPEAQEAGEVPRASSSKGSTSTPGASLGPHRPHRALTRAAAEAAARAARRKARAAQHQIEQKAGAAAPFVVETGDNSIPTYGSEASAAQLGAAEAPLSAYLSARAAGEWGQACAQMSAQLQKQIALLANEAETGGGCPKAYGKLAEKIPASARADPLTAGITALRVESPHAFALFYGPGEQQYMMPLEEEGGGWKVTQLEPVPWPIGSSAG